MSNKLRIGVFMGGRSIEREVSFNSGRTICDHLDTEYFTVIPLFQTSEGALYILPWTFVHRGKISDFEHRLVDEAQHIGWDDLRSLIDFMYIAVHGRYAEDGTLQGMLTVLGIPYLGSKVLASALSMDKNIQRTVLQMHKIEVPRGFVLTAFEYEHLKHDDVSLRRLVCSRMQEQAIAFPWVIKPCKEGSSLGISIIINETELCAALRKAAYADDRIVQSILIEERIEGMEFTQIIITDPLTSRPIPFMPTEIGYESGSLFFDYAQKYMPGRAVRFTPPRCSAEIITRIQEKAIQTMQALGITTIARIDGFVRTDGSIVIIDPNTLSGMGPATFLFRQAAEIGMGHTQLINHLLYTELAYYNLSFLSVNHMEHTHYNQRTKIAILMGGNSNERETSFESGRNVTYKLSPHKYEAIPLFVDEDMQLYRMDERQLVCNSTKEVRILLEPSSRVLWSELSVLTDFVFIALHGGAGEDGSVQGALEMLGLPYNGSSVFASALCMDKYKTNDFLAHHGLAVPKNVFLEKTQWSTDNDDQLKHCDNIVEQLLLPVIVKPHNDGCSVGVFLVHTSEELVHIINTLFSERSQILIEEYIQGIELTVGVMGNDKVKALPPSQSIAAHGVLSMEEKFLPGAGENQTPAPLPSEILSFIQAQAEKAYISAGCRGYARIDCFYQSALISPTGKDRVVIIEINTLPALTPATCLFHQAAEIGIRAMDFIDTVVQLGCEMHAVHHKTILLPTTEIETVSAVG